MQRQSATIASVWVWALLLVSGSSIADDSESATGLPRSPSPDGATVEFRNIEDGDVLPLTFVVKFKISGMGIAPAGSNIDNTGHHHLLINVDELPAMDHPLPATDQIRHFGKGQTETELTLPAGEHSLQLLFADYLHTPHDPPVVSDRILVTVSPDAAPQKTEESGD